MSEAFPLATYPVHLGLGATVVREPRMTGMEWYAAYSERHAKDGVEGRLVSFYTFTESWKSWEMHPKGEELVVCVAGELVLHQEIDGAVVTTTLRAGDAIVNPRGVWHTADASAPATALFITAGEGTEHRTR